jgi:tRNA(Ile)-lysidine synthase
MMERVQQFVREHSLLHPGQPLWAAVSGGVDSMVMLDVLQRMEHPVHVAHVDHGLRGEESDGDRAFVVQYCAQRGLPCQVKKVDVMGHAQAMGVSVQMAARELRYAWFGGLLEQAPAVLATAHHADDRAETLLLNLARGAGLWGWGSIAPRSAAYIRPLLACSRAQILQHAKQYSVPYREDSSNKDLHYLRNRVRHEWIPMMERATTGVGATLVRNADRLADMVRVCEQHFAASLDTAHESGSAPQRVPCALVMRSGVPVLFLHWLLRDQGFHPNVLEQMAKAIAHKRTGATFSGQGWVVLVDRDHLLVHKVEPTAQYVGSLSEDLAVPSGMPLRAQFAAFPVHGERDAQVAWLSVERLRFPLQVRPWRPGDRYHPLGTRGSRKVSDVLVDAKVPLLAKPGVHVVLSGEQIVWLVGHRPASDIAAQPGAAHCLRLQWVAHEGK